MKEKREGAHKAGQLGKAWRAIGQITCKSDLGERKRRR